MSVTTLQITLTGSAQQLSATSIKARWIAFQNNAAAAQRIGDANVTSSLGLSLAASGGSFTAPPKAEWGQLYDLSNWWVIGTSTQKLDVVYDSVNG